MATDQVANRMAAQEENCPDHHELVALSRGELGEDALEAVCQHVAACASCDSYLAAVEDSADSIFGNLRQFYNHEPWINRAEFRSVEVRAKAIPIDCLPGVSATAAADPRATAPDHGRLQRVGKYELCEELGRGGMGIVYVGRHTKLNRKVAVKVILPEHADDPRIRARFRREMEAVGELVHPHIVAATDADEADGCHFLVMELIDGMNVDAVLKRCSPLAVADACEIIRQAAVGLQYVFEHQRVHRDLKPSNLMLSTDGVVKILDLGLARLFSDNRPSGELTRGNMVMGTADYMAPEQWEDSRKVDIRADIYSLGCTFYKLLAGKAPFSVPELKPEQLKKRAHALLAYPALETHRSDVPAALAAVLDRMLEKNPDQRFGTPQEVVDALAPFARGCDCRQLIARAMERSMTTRPGEPKAIEPTASIVSPRPPWMTTRPGEPKAIEPSKETFGVKELTPGSRKPAKLGPVAKKWIGQRWILAAGGVAVAAYVLLAWALGGAWRTGGSHPEQPAAENPPKAAAANQPLVFSHWNALLKEKPKELVWAQQPNDFLDFVKESGQLRVQQSSAISLLGLGKTDNADYQIRLSMIQTRWLGRAGLFFGYHEDVVNNKPRVRYQWLEIEPGPPGKGFIVTRQVATREQGPEGKVITKPFGFAQAKLKDLPLANYENTLEIHVKPHRLMAVIWNGNRLPTLETADDAGQLKDADFIGEFGAFNRRGTTIFASASFMPFERKDP